MKPGYEHLLQRAEQLIARIEAVLPQALPEPDWSSSTAFRYRKRSVGRSSLEPVLHIGAMRLDDLKEIEKMVHFYYELGINIEGIEVIINLLLQNDGLRRELNNTRRKLLTYESLI